LKELFRCATSSHQNHPMETFIALFSRELYSSSHHITPRSRLLQALVEWPSVHGGLDAIPAP
jgi:hypothetical protein